MVTWVWCGWASMTMEGRSLKGIDDVAIGNRCQVIIIWKGTLETRGVQLWQDDLERGSKRDTVTIHVYRRLSSDPWRTEPDFLFYLVQTTFPHKCQKDLIQFHNSTEDEKIDTSEPDLTIYVIDESVTDINQQRYNMQRGNTTTHYSCNNKKTM